MTDFVIATPGDSANLPADMDLSHLMDVQNEILFEMARALEKFPDCFHLPDGTGGGARKTWEAMARAACDRAHREGRITHTHVFEEEAAEAMAAETTEDLRKELVQVGAMAMKWIMDIDSREKVTG